MPIHQGQIFDTIGIEMEGCGIEYTNLAERLMSRFPQFMEKGLLQVTKDASTQFRASGVKTTAGKNLRISEHTVAGKSLANRTNGTVMGYELITSPLEVSKLEEVIYPSVMFLVELGDFISPRCATHFHIGYAQNLRHMKNLLKISLSLDPVLYRLGGMGTVFRGYTNNAAYARPLMNSVYVPVSGSPYNVEIPQDSKTVIGTFAQIINPMGALNADSMDKFWACFGVRSTDNKYHPSRYVGINFYSLLAHGTIEYRHPNQTHNPALIIAIAKMLRAITELSSMIDSRTLSYFDPINPNREISFADAYDIINKLMSAARQRELHDLPNEREMEIIMNTLRASSFREISEIPVMTHIKCTVNPETVAKGGLKLAREVLAPTHVDIHTINLIDLFSQEE